MIFLIAAAVNPLTGEYILVSPHRNKRPWQGQTELPQTPSTVHYDPSCYLCPGNARADGQRNPVYTDTFTFVNDFAAILPPSDSTPAIPTPPHSLLVAEPVFGTCDVLVFHPRHDLTLARLSLEDICRIINEWIRIYKLRGSQEGVEYVQIFENKGSIMGCSNPHPHGQVWSLSEVPSLPSKEIASLQRYSLLETSTTGRAPRGPKDRPCLLCDYVHLEISLSERIVVRNDHWVTLVPWWATWPFEVLVLPYQRHIPSICDLSDDEKRAFADILSRITIRYDNLFTCSFAYSMGIHQRPTPCQTQISETKDENIMHLHLHFNPPLLRSASIRKFLVGFELMAEAQRDLTAEQAAEKLRACSDIHYSDNTPMPPP